MRISPFVFTFLTVISVAAFADEKAVSLQGMDAVTQNPAVQGGVDVSVPAEEDYICPMHPSVHGKKGGTCPICGMTLVPAHPDHSGMDMGSAPPEQTPVPAPEEQKHEGQKHEGQQGGVMIAPVYQQALGIRTDQASLHDFGGTITTYGRIVHSSRHEYDVALRTDGWIVDLRTSAIGDTVKKGDLLFTLYSPALLSVQSDYLNSRKGSLLLSSTEQRLALSGMDEQAIALLKRKSQLLKETPFYAPSDGTIISLNARKGSFVRAGDTVLQMHDLSEVWVEASVPLPYLPQVTAGTKAKVVVAPSGKTYETAVDLVYPVVDGQSRAGIARLVLANPDGLLKPDMYADVVFETDTRQRLAVPADAVLHDKMGSYVMRSLGGGRFYPAMVETGASAGGRTEILSGLAEGDDIVFSGQFMIDAESSLQGGMAGMNHD